jgi:hypothetical protein
LIQYDEAEGRKPDSAVPVNVPSGKKTCISTGIDLSIEGLGTNCCNNASFSAQARSFQKKDPKLLHYRRNFGSKPGFLLKSLQFCRLVQNH